MAEKLFFKTPLTPHLLLVDGLPRAGKMLTAKLVSHFEGIEFIQVREPVDHVPMMYGLGQFDADSAAAFLRLQLDVAIHDRAIGRNLNMRASDGTTLLRSGDPTVYEKRAENPDDLAALSAFLESGLVPFFFTHQSLPFISLFFRAAADLHVLEIVRHPVTLAASWYRRGWGDRWGTDPRVFTLMADRNSHAIPWFALDWAEEFVEGSPMDRVLRSVLALTEACNAGLSALTDEQRERILMISYEQLATDTDNAIARMETFLGTRRLPYISEVCRREKLPKSFDRTAFSQCEVLINSCGSKKLVNQLFEAAQAYEENWDFSPTHEVRT